MNGQVAEKIRVILNEALAPALLVVEDQSARHSGHAGAMPGEETHFALTITSAAFVGLSRIERHQKVYALLSPLMNNPIHALTLRLSAHEDK
jgi:BolA protein